MLSNKRFCSKIKDLITGASVIEGLAIKAVSFKKPRNKLNLCKRYLYAKNSKSSKIKHSVILSSRCYRRKHDESKFNCFHMILKNYIHMVKSLSCIT